MRLAYIFGLLLFLSAVCPAADRTLSQTVDVTTARVQPAALGFFRGESVSYTVTPRLGSAAISVSTNATATWTLCVQTNVNLAVLDTAAVSISSNGVCVFYSPVASNTMAAGAYDSFVRIQDGATLVTASRTTFNVYKSPYSEAITVLPFSLAEPLWVAASNRVVYSNQMGTGATWTGTNWTFAGGSSGISASDATNIVSGLAYPLSGNPSNFCTLAAAAALTNGFIKLAEVPADNTAWTTNRLPVDATNGWEVGSHSALVTTNDSRLTDSRTPLAHSQSLSTITDFVASAYASSNQGAKADAALPVTGLTDGTITLLKLYNTNGMSVSADSGSILSGYMINGGLMQVLSTSAYGSMQAGSVSYGSMQIGPSVGGPYTAPGAMQRGRVVFGYMVLGSDADTYGAMQLGSVYGANPGSWNASATNNGVGAVQLLDLTAGQSANTTAGGDGSILLGAGVASNRYAIVAGDGQASHGDGSITAGGGFYGDGTPLTGVLKPSDTNSLPYGISSATSTSIAQAVVAPWTNQVTAAAVVAAGGLTNVWNDPSFTVYDLLGDVASGTATITRLKGNAFFLAPTGTATYITADISTFPATMGHVFSLAVVYSNQTWGFVNGTMTNVGAAAEALTTNSYIFVKEYGWSKFAGRVEKQP